MAQTKPHVSAELLAQQALAEGVDLVVASGGDGTVGAVAGEAGGARRGGMVLGGGGASAPRRRRPSFAWCPDANAVSC
jgi:diacylglycerol kinase family enzyme